MGKTPLTLKETLDMVLDSKFLVTKQMTDQFLEDGAAPCECMRLWVMFTRGCVAAQAWHRCSCRTSRACHMVS